MVDENSCVSRNRLTLKKYVLHFFFFPQNSKFRYLLHNYHSGVPVLDVKKITLRNYKIYTEYTLMQNQYKTTTEFMLKHISSTTLTKTPRVRFMVSVI